MSHCSMVFNEAVFCGRLSQGYALGLFGGDGAEGAITGGGALDMPALLSDENGLSLNCLMINKSGYCNKLISQLKYQNISEKPEFDNFYKKNHILPIEMQRLNQNVLGRVFMILKRK
jgi:hypothetical protein